MPRGRWDALVAGLMVINQNQSIILRSLSFSNGSVSGTEVMVWQPSLIYRASIGPDSRAATMAQVGWQGVFVCVVSVSATSAGGRRGNRKVLSGVSAAECLCLAPRSVMLPETSDAINFKCFPVGRHRNLFTQCCMKIDGNGMRDRGRKGRTGRPDEATAVWLKTQPLAFPLR